MATDVPDKEWSDELLELIKEAKIGINLMEGEYFITDIIESSSGSLEFITGEDGKQKVGILAQKGDKKNDVITVKLSFTDELETQLFEKGWFKDEAGRFCFLLF